MPRSRRQHRVARWSLHDAKNKLSAVVNGAADGVPQIVTRRGVEAAVVISYDEYERLTAQRRRPQPSLAEYLLEVPTSEEELFERIELAPRENGL